jgi:hypothetical protein
VIHLRTPSAGNGYDHANPLRTETAQQAGEIDCAIGEAWKGHPRYAVVPSETDFVTKASRAVTAIAAEIPSCCNAKREP